MDRTWVPPRPEGPVAWSDLPALPPAPSWPPPPLPARRYSRWRVAVAAVVAALVVAGAVAVGIRPSEPQAPPRRYTFLRIIDGDPVRWNPCLIVHYVVNDELAPPGVLVDVQGAVAHVSEATGINFVFDGTTTEFPSNGRKTYQPKRYGKGWAPILIAWVDPATSELRFGKPGDEAIGLGEPLFSPVGFQPVQYVSGEIAINSAYSGPHGFAVPGALGLVVQHEMGHVVGLGHADLPGELMGRSGGGATQWGPGDLQGLRQLGSAQGCLLEPPLP